MLQATVFALSIFPDGNEVDIVISRLIARDAEAWSHVCVQLQLLAQRQVEGPMPLPKQHGDLSETVAVSEEESRS